MRPDTHLSRPLNKHSAGPERNGRVGLPRHIKSCPSSLAGQHHRSLPSSNLHRHQCLLGAVIGVLGQAMLRTGVLGPDQLFAVARPKKRGTARWLVHSMVEI